MRALTIGFDLGSREAGLAVLDDGQLVITRNWLQSRSKMPLEERMMEFWAWVRESLERLRWQYCEVDVVIGIEQPYARWISAASVLWRQYGAVEGIASLTVADYWPDVRIMPIPPQKAKAALTGRGNALKSDMVRAVQQQFECIVNEHVADAIGVALAAWAKQKEKALLDLAEKEE